MCFGCGYSAEVVGLNGGGQYLKCKILREAGVDRMGSFILTRENKVY